MAAGARQAPAKDGGNFPIDGHNGSARASGPAKQVPPVAPLQATQGAMEGSNQPGQSPATTATAQQAGEAGSVEGMQSTKGKAKAGSGRRKNAEIEPVPLVKKQEVLAAALLYEEESPKCTSGQAALEKIMCTHFEESIHRVSCSTIQTLGQLPTSPQLFVTSKSTSGTACLFMG